MRLEIYIDMRSAPCRALWLFLQSTEIPYEALHLDLIKGDHLKEEMLEKNPFHQLPFIIDDGCPMIESAAIMKYLAMKHNVPEHWYPRQDQLKQAKQDELLHWLHWNIRRPAVTILHEWFLDHASIGNLAKRPMDKTACDKAREELRLAEERIATYFLGDQPFLGGDDVSIGDLLIYCQLMQAETTGLYKCDTKVTAWKERMEDNLQAHLDPCRDALAKVKEVYNSHGD